MKAVEISPIRHVRHVRRPTLTTVRAVPGDASAPYFPLLEARRSFDHVIT